MTYYIAIYQSNTSDDRVEYISNNLASLEAITNNLIAASIQDLKKNLFYGVINIYSLESDDGVISFYNDLEHDSLTLVNGVLFKYNHNIGYYDIQIFKHGKEIKDWDTI